MRYWLSIIFLWVSFISMAVAAPPADEFGKLPMIYGDAAISPDGSRVAAFYNLKGNYAAVVFDLSDQKREPVVIGLSDGVKPAWLKWANNTYVLASIWDNQKVGTTPVTTGFLYSLNADEGKGKMLVKPRGIIRQYNNQVIDFLKDDPDHIMMSFSDEDAFKPDVQKVNIVTGRYKRIRRGSESIQKWYTDLRGEIRIGKGLYDKSVEKWRLTIRDADSDKWRSSQDYPGLDSDERIYGFTANPDELIIGRYQGKDTLGLYIYDLGQKTITRKLFHNDKYDVNGLIYSGDGDEVVGASYVGDSREVELFGNHDTPLQRLRNQYPEYQVDYMDQSENGEKIVVKLSHASEPGAIYLLDTKTDNIKRISHLRESLDAAQLGEVISVRYKARDGQKIPAYVTLPPTITDGSQLKKLPFIILPHGGPYARDDRRFDYLAQFFATRGFGVLQMNFRGSAGYGKAYEDAGRKNWVVMQEDVEDGARWLLKKGYADPERTCIAGWSYGGYAALIGAIKNPDLYACTISMAGVTDLKDMIRDIQKYRFGRLSARNFVLRGFEDKDDIKENSPVKRASEMTGPVFIAHGELDQRVHFDQFKRMRSALKKGSADVTAIVFEDEDHFLSNQSNRIKFFKKLEKFLEKSVGPSEYKMD